MHVARFAIFALLTTICAGCGLTDLFGSSSSAVGADAGTCNRNVEALADLLTSPVACVSGAQCPAGAFCNADLGACEWDCMTDGDCTAFGGGTCSCSGQCSGGGGGGGGGGATTCERDRNLLIATKATRSCVFDEECPQGSRCDGATRSCTWDCLETVDALAGCPAGQFCDCFGRCGTTGDPVPPTDEAIVLEVSPRFNPVTGTTTVAWAQRRLDVTLRAPLGPFTTEVTGAVVEARAGTGLVVSCDNKVTYAATCKINGGWTAASATGLVQRSNAKNVWVKPAGTANFATSGEVTVLTSIARDTRVVAVFAQPNAATGEPLPAASQPVEGNYEGEVVFLGASPDALGPSTTATNPLRLRVRAAVNATTVDFYDGVGVLAPGGKLRVNGTALTMKWLAPPTSPTGVANDSSGELVAVVAPVAGSRTHVATVGLVSGRFHVRVPFSTAGTTAISYLHYEYRLTRKSVLTACGSGCASGTTCDTSFVAGGACIAGPAWATTAGTGSTLAVATADAIITWTQSLVDKVRTGLTSSPFFCVLGACASAYPTMFIADDVYEGTTGIGRADASRNVSTIHADRLRNGDDGRPLCATDFSQFVAWIPVSGTTGPFLTIAYTSSLTNAAGTPYASTTAMCDAAYTLSSGAGPWAPCVDPTPLASTPTATGRFANLSTYTAKRASCEAVRMNHNAGIAPAAPVASLATFLSANCRDSGAQLRVGNAGQTGTDNHKIYLCPFKEALLGPFDAAANAERLLCYDPNLASTSVMTLASGRLGTGATTVSGDPLCTSGAPMHGVDLVSHADRADAENTAIFGAANMISACLADLAPRDVPTSFSGYGQWVLDAAIRDFFKDRTCFSSAHFFPALRQLTDSLSTTPSANTNARANKLVQRLVAQWLTLHGFLAKEGAQQSALAQVLASATDADVGDTDAAATLPTHEALLERMERGWNLVLAQSHSTKLLAIPAADILAPDYRTGVTAQPHHDQGVGLPAIMLETGALHYELVEKYLRAQQFLAYGQCYVDGTSGIVTSSLAKASRSLRYLESVEGLAVSLYDGATAQVCPATTCATGFTCTSGRCVSNTDGSWARSATVVVWQQRWLDARTRFEVSRDRALFAAAELSACKNPLGYDERAVPIFFGDVVGASSRFFAASDYLLNGWAIPAVQSSRAALFDARNAFLQKRDSEVQATMVKDDADRRLEAVKGQYGQPIIDLCGIDNMEAKDVLDAFAAGTLKPETCFIASNLPQCKNTGTSGSDGVFWSINEGATPEPSEMVTQDMARSRLCQWNELKTELGIPAADDRTAMAAGFAAATVSTVGGQNQVTAGGKTKPAEILFETNFYNIAPTRRAQVQARCADLLLGVDAELPPADAASPDMTNRAECYRGAIGESLLGTIASKKDAEIATKEWEDTEAIYNLTVEGCIALASNIDWRNETRRNHTIEMGLLASARAAASGIASVLSVNGPGGWFQAAAHGISAVMEVRQQMFANKMARIEENLALSNCAREVRGVSLRIDNAAAIVERSLLDADRSLVAFSNLNARLRQLLLEGKAAVAREQGRLVPDLAFHYWLDERVDRFEKDFAWAKLLTYLAMRAVEYEYQQSLDLRERVLTATHPDHLLDAVQVMQQEQVARTINNRRPEEDILVLSLRDEVLNLGDQFAAAPGERGWTAQQRFQHRLWSPEYAVYDELGGYLGQGIPFALGPTGPLEHRCGERLWRVTATIQGDLLGVDAPAAPVFLVKRNSFGSQWCTGHGDGDAFQVGAMQPASQLFHPEDHGGTEAEGIASTAAALMPWFNVRRSDFYREQYNEGGSEELAGRGLYGDYVLLFPAAGLLNQDFALEQVEDVLLRFDYLSVDDLSSF